MSEDANVIKSFLVSLGFKVVDETKMVDAIKRTEKVAVELGAALEALAAAAVAAVTTVSEKFESLYYSSQRVRSSVANIRAFDYAVSQLGGTAAGAQASLEGFGDFLRMSPGGEGLLRGLGLQTRDAQGNLRQTTDLMAEFGQKAKAMPLYQARAYASMLGMDPRTLDALMRGTGGFQKHYLDMIKESGVDQEKAAEASARWAQRWKDLRAQLDLFTDGLALRLQGPMGALITWFKNADKATHGLSTTLIALGALLMPLLLVLDPVVVAVLALAGGLAALAADYENFKSGAGSGIDWGPWAKQIDQIATDLPKLTDDLSNLIKGLSVDLGPAASSGFSVFLKWVDACIKELDHLVRAMDAVRRGKWGEAAAETGEAIADSPAGQLAQAAAKQEQAAQAAMKPASLSGSAAARLKQFHDYLRAKGLDEVHTQGILAGMVAENGQLDPNALGPRLKNGHRAFGLGQWLGDRLEALRAMKGTHPDWKQQLDFLVAELMGGVAGVRRDKGGAAVMGAGSVEGIMSKYLEAFMRPGDGLNGDLLRGHKFLAGRMFDQALGTNVNINQRTTINVHGSDAKSTAHAVAGQQDRVNGNMVRWAKATAS